MKTTKAMLLDIDYLKEERSIIRLFFKTPKGKLVLTDPSFEPYFYITVNCNPKKAVKRLMEREFNGVKIKRIEIVKRKLTPKDKPIDALKLFFNSTKELKDSREEIRAQEFVTHKREYDIPFGKRYLIDRDLEPLSMYEISYDEKSLELKAIKKINEKPFKLKMAAIDIETYSRGRFSDPKRDPIIMASYVDSEEKLVICTKEINENYAIKAADEKELIKILVDKIKQKDLDIIITYNGDGFDLPYLRERARQLGFKLDIGVDNSEPVLVKKGLDTAAKIRGRLHIDAYQVLRMLSRFGVVNLVKMDLESVNSALFDEEKEKIAAEEINDIWESGKGLERLADYNRKDSEVAYRIVAEYLPLFVELGKLVHYTLFDVSRASSSQLVEALLIIESFKKKVLVPNKPNEEEVKARLMQTYQGGFVYEPLPGLHENIAVVDFTSLHPTIIISHNVSPDTVNCEHEECKQKNMSPAKHWFCTKRKGFLPNVVEELFEERVQLKNRLKSLQKGTHEYNIVYARQHSLKIILNSFYGTLGYARFRWYSREAASAVTAWSREYVKMVAREAEKEGFTTIYGDTDSAFIKIPSEKTQEDVKKFLKKINAKLPGVMNLELEGFYKRGIFVTKKTGEQAAKKRYALIDYNNNLKIVGFEYVRRDWAPIAKETQRKVIEAILKEGKPEKAIEIVRQKIKELREGKTKKKELVIYSQIKKAINSYESIGPHVAAAKKAIAKGKTIEEGSVIGYIVTKCGKTISDKAQLEEYVNEGNYDAEYYIKNQLIPAVIKIIREFGYSEEDLIEGGRQASLNSFT